MTHTEDGLDQGLPDGAAQVVPYGTSLDHGPYELAEFLSELDRAKDQVGQGNSGTDTGGGPRSAYLDRGSKRFDLATGASVETSKDDRELPAELEDLIRNGVPVGQRSERFFYVVAALKDRGYSVDEIESLLADNPTGAGEKYRDRLRPEIER